MRPADPRVLLLAPALMLAAAPPAAAREGRATMFVVPAGTLDRALAAVAAQGAIDVGGAAAGIAAVRVAGLRGRMTPAAALIRLLRDTPFEAIRVDAVTYRIARRAMPARPRRAPLVPAPPSAPRLPERLPDIVVTASKTAVDRLRLPGAFTILATDRTRVRDASAGLSEVAAAAPVIQETALGSGRNKLFIRGVADSSFGGPTQSTTAVYWNDTAVAYAGADPDLNLYDVDRIEVLEGPQGTLYGAGAIGGVIRVEPRRPDVSAIAAALSAGVRMTPGAATGTDLAGMLNVPVAGDTAALRMVAYRVQEGGYVDDTLRGLRDVNGVRTLGGRLALRVQPGAGWSIDAGLIGQRIDADDLQYAERGLPGLARASAFAQPFRQRYGLAQLRVAHRSDGGIDWLTAIGHASRDARARFDATRFRPVPIAYDTDEQGRFVTVESRLAKGTPDGAGWLIGAAFSEARDRFTRRFGRPDRQREIVGTVSRTTDLALFGQAGVAIGGDMVLTLGVRMTRQRLVGEALASARPLVVPGRTATRIDPTIGANWKVGPRSALYARYQSGFRAGGVVVTPEIGRVATLKPDAIDVVEAGVRHERQGPLGIAGAIGLSAARWRRVQADLVSPAGFPFTLNLDDSRILGIEASGSWVPHAGLTISGALFANRTRRDSPDASIRRLRVARLPSTPPLAGAGGVTYAWQAGREASADIGIDGRYVGTSSVGSVAPFDLDQGGYAELDARAGWRRGHWQWSVRVDNLLGTAGDRFAGANPFTLARRDTYTPLRPRAIRLGVTIE